LLTLQKYDNIGLDLVELRLNLVLERVRATAIAFKRNNTPNFLVGVVLGRNIKNCPSKVLFQGLLQDPNRFRLRIILTKK